VLVKRDLHKHIHGTDESSRVTSLELFFDLVFVFAITQVTALMSHDPTWAGALHGLMVLGLLWFGWTAFAWLGNQAKADEGLLRSGLVIAMAAMFAVGLSIPEAFHDRHGGLVAPLVFVAGFVVGRMVHLGVYFVAAGDDDGLRRQLLRTAVPVGIWAVLLLAGALAGESLRVVLWAVALLVDYVGIFTTSRAGGWRLPAPAHFAERHGLIIIIAIGESIVATGVGGVSEPISWALLTAVLLGLAISVALWWTYFDVVAPVAERVLTRAAGQERARLARDSYTYLHFPMVVGIVFLALGMKTVVSYVADTGHHGLGDALPTVPLVAMYGGVALYLIAHVCFRLRNIHSVNKQRVLVAGLLVVLLPVAAHLPALVAVGVLAALLIGLIAYEAIRFAESRDSIRHAAHD
jgi:low temperature requirement protein LtrA